MPSKTKPRIGVFGGAFDPPHQAHVALAQAAFTQLGLGDIRLVPTGQAAHRSLPLTAGEHRLAMLRLAFQNPEVPHPPGFSWTVDERELRRPGVSFMVDTLHGLHQDNPATDLVLLLGTDQAQVFTTWHRWEDILGLATLAVAARGTASQSAPSENTRFEFENHPQARVVRLNFPLMPVSATEIRQYLAQSGLEPTGLTSLISPSVASYIAQHQLYKAA